MGWSVSLPHLQASSPLIQPPGRQNVPILSKEEAVYILLAGRPKDPDYVEDMKSMEQSMHRAREQVHFNKESLKHRRGAYPMKSTGISYGGGSKVSASRPS